MSIEADPDELVQDRFDDQSFEDAPLSDAESNFDEQDLQSIDEGEPVPQSEEQLYCPQNWLRPALSTIPEESKIDDIATSEISRVTPPDIQNSACDELSITKTSIKSSDFITDQKASDIMQREQELFLRGHGYIIPDDPRFNRSHFEKENSWEPSVINQLSFDASSRQYGADSLPLPESAAVSVPNRCDQFEENGPDRGAVGVSSDKAVSREETSTRAGAENERILTNLTNSEARDDHLKNAARTPQRTERRLLHQSMLYDSPNPSDSTVGMVQTSTPVSMVAKLASRARRLELDENFHGVSMISPADATKEGQRGVDEQSMMSDLTNTTILSVGKIQSILKSQPSSTSPLSLMRVLDHYRKDRVKAKKIAGTLPPPPPPRRVITPTEDSRIPSEPTCADSHERSKATAMRCRDERASHVKASSLGDRSANMQKNVLPGDAVSVKTRPSNTQSDQRPVSTNPVTSDDDGRNGRPGSARSSGSTLTGVGARSSSQMSSDVSRRSVLHIPKHELVFGFVAIGDTAVANVEVVNRAEHSVRIRAKLLYPGPFTLLDSQILVLDPSQSTLFRIEFSPTQNARFKTILQILAEGGGGPQVGYRMPIRGLGGAAIVTVKARDDLRLSRSGSYILQSSYESTFSFTLTNSGNRRAFSRIIVLYTGESNTPEQVPVDIRPAPGIIMDRGDSKQVSIRLRSPLPVKDWRSSQNSIVSTASTNQPRAVSQLQVIVYWGEETTRLRLRCYERMVGDVHIYEGLQFTETFVGEDATFCPPEDYPISYEDLRLFEQSLRMCTIYVCSPRIRMRPSLVSNSSAMERSLQPEDTFREKSTFRVAVPDQTLR